MKKKKHVSLIDCPVCNNPREKLLVIPHGYGAYQINCSQCRLQMAIDKNVMVENRFYKMLIGELP